MSGESTVADAPFAAGQEFGDQALACRSAIILCHGAGFIAHPGLRRQPRTSGLTLRRLEPRRASVGMLALSVQISVMP